MPQFKQFSSPHCHPSSLDSASTPEAFAKRAVELGAISLACTDHGSIAAAYKIYELAKKNSLIPIIGIELYFRSDDCPILTKLGVPKTDTVPRGIDKEFWKSTHPTGSFFDYNKYYHMTVHCMDFKAYKALIKMLSVADARAEVHGSERKALFTWDQIEELATYNVTVGSSCLVGMVERHLMKSNVEAAAQYFLRLKHLFGDRFYVEVFPHVCSHNWDNGVYIYGKAGEKEERLRFYPGKNLRTNKGEIHADELAKDSSGHTHLIGIKNNRVWTDIEPVQIVSVQKIEGFIQNECSPAAPDGDIQWGCNKWIIGMGKKHSVKAMISDDCHYASKDLKIVQDVRLAQMGNWKFFGEYEMKSSQDAWEYCEKHLQLPVKQFEEWIDNSHEWAHRMEGFEFEVETSLPTKFFPKDTLSHLKHLIKKHGRYKPEYASRLKYEIDLLHKNGTIDLLPYFFIDEEVCRVYRDEGLLTGVSRGSAGGLLISYLIGITHIDPIKWDLSVNRFITLDRILSGKKPDIDQDLPGRELLVGGHVTEVVTIQADDGTMHEVPSSFKVDTVQGEMTIKSAVETGTDFREWWA
jgi:DNA polymerase III alpha subunit